MTRTIHGISIDDLSVFIARKQPLTGAVSASPLGGTDSLPNAILLPRLKGEPCRFDLGPIPHPRGSGLDWPLEAIADSTHGVGRIPTSTLLQRIESGNTATWNHGTLSDAVLTDSLAEAISQLDTAKDLDREIIFVMPNHWGENLQQEMIDAFQSQQVPCKMLWRPVAAGLEWCHKFAGQLDHKGRKSRESIGKLLSVHLGFDNFEITELDLVVWDTQHQGRFIVPARERPHTDNRVPSFGFRRACTTLNQKIASVSGPKKTQVERYSQVWKRFWCTNELRHSSASSLRPGELYDANQNEFERPLLNTTQLSFQEFEQRLRLIKHRLRGHYDGIVFSGELVHRSTHTDQRGWEWLSVQLGVTTPCRLIENVNTECGVLAKGACRFGENLELQLPTYLDTLPQIEMVISEGGEPTWINLLEHDQKWVDGGKLWERPERIQNLSISAGSVDLKLAVAHEEFEQVREVVTDLPQAADEAEEISLSVQVFPAQGKARIGIHPDREEFFAGERVFVDWKGMKTFRTEDGQTTDKASYLNHLPRSYPEILPRIHSRKNWPNAKRSLNLLGECIRSNEPRAIVERALTRTRSALQQKDQSLYPQDATAFGSDGCSPDGFNITDFLDRVWPYYLRNNPSGFVRAIAYSHVDHEELTKRILHELQRRYVDADFVLAAGKCLRLSHDVSIFANAMLHTSVGEKKLTWWKALAELLRFRDSATQCISSEDCLSLVELALEKFRRERERSMGKEVFRQMCLSIVYLLRRRAFDDTFLEPESDLALEVKSEFQMARKAAKNGSLRMIGGSIDLPQQLQLIIDYVDRKGKGQLLIGG